MAFPMIRVLVLIAITGFLVGVVALSAAAGLGGPELAARNWRWIGAEWWDSDHDWPARRFEGPAATREMAWDGSSALVLDVPAEVTFSQAPGPGTVTLRGPKDLIEQVTLSQGRLSLENGFHAGRLEIAVTAPEVTRFEANGDDRLDIRNYRQDALQLVIRGSAEAEVQGQARRAEVSIEGSGDADLDDLTLDDAKVDVSGSGEVSVAPRKAADLDISGSGEVTLRSRPERLQSQVSGSGRIVQMGGDDETPR
jgi:hypothetical protein